MMRRLPQLVGRRTALLGGLGLFGLALLLRLYRIEAQSLWLDEGSTWQFTRGSWRVLLADLLNPAAAYPLYHLLLKGWVALFGDSELALRLPSALAGAVAALLTYGAGRELQHGDGLSTRHQFSTALAGLLVAVAPFAIWYSQEAKAYSLLLLCAAACTWLVLRALRLRSLRAWLLVAIVALLSLFVHRLALLLALGLGWAWLVANDHPRRERWLQLAAAAALLLASIAVVGAMARGLGADRAATGAYIPAGPLEALWLSFSRFSLDRWPGDAPLWWLVPWGVLFAWGLVRVVAASCLPSPACRLPRALLCLLVVPLALFLAQLAYTRVYEARYLIVVFPAWALVLAYPLHSVPPTLNSRAARLVARAMLLFAVATCALSLVQPERGLYSGAPVKEQYREVLRELALRLHPDDAVVIHPGYLRPLYDYYMPRLSADPAPVPLTFADFWQGETSYGQREWDIERRAKLAGYARSFVLIAPDHARTVDVPKPGDEYGLVGLFWQYSRDQSTWPCGIWRRNGAHLLCQEAPERYISGELVQAATLSGARFGEQLTLLGYTLKRTGPEAGSYRAGGNIPLSLFWDVEQPLAQDYSFFLHLCQDCAIPPLASDDGPPLSGYLPTSTWLPGRPARDDRAIHLPADLPPGRYTLLLGVYRPGDPSPTARLGVRGDSVLGSDQLVLGTVEVR